MGCVHHSNYIRWMEEARVNLMEQMGCGYKAMGASGIMSPVLEVHCQYRSMVRFDDHVTIHVWVKEYNAIRMTLGYEMRDAATGELRREQALFPGYRRQTCILKTFLPSVGHRILQRGPGAGFPVMTASVGDAVIQRVHPHMYICNY